MSCNYFKFNSFIFDYRGKWSGRFSYDSWCVSTTGWDAICDLADILALTAERWALSAEHDGILTLTAEHGDVFSVTIVRWAWWLIDLDRSACWLVKLDRSECWRIDPASWAWWHIHLDCCTWWRIDLYCWACWRIDLDCPAWIRIEIDCLSMVTYWPWLPEHGGVLTLTPWLPASVRPQAPCILLLEAMNHWSINGKPSISIECLPNCWKNHLDNLNHEFSNYCELINSIKKKQLIDSQ